MGSLHVVGVVCWDSPMALLLHTGRFPFEGIEMSNATNLEEVSEHVWRQQNSQKWYDNPLIRAVSQQQQGKWLTVAWPASLSNAARA